MAGYSSLHITMPQPDPFYPFNNPSINSTRHNSQGSLSSNGSSNSYPSPNNDRWDPQEAEESHGRRPSKRGVSTFINKLFGIVSDRRNHHLISWNPSGTSFLVCNATRFSQEILPEHFKHSNFSSFVRQLNMYGFHKINKSPRGQRGNNENEIWEFSHPMFQRGRPNSLEDIKRKAMDSELLRRETGDMHASFAMVQLSQADLLQQFRVLQENFSNLLQGFEDLRKAQLQQQIILKKLTERLGVTCSIFDFASDQGQNCNNNMSQPSLFVTSPSVPPLQNWEQQQTAMPPIYQNNNTSNEQAAFSFSMNGQNPLPPSPVSSVLLSSPSSCEKPYTN